MSSIHPASVEFQFRPIAHWNHGTGPKRVNSPFRVGAGRTQDELRCELAAIGVRSAVIQADLDPSDIRLDGVPRSNARFRTGRVILSFTHPKLGDLSMPCWQFRDLWDNLRAIVKTLEALRAVDRYGVTQRAEQYRGWSALPPAGTAIVVAEFATAEDAARFLLKTAHNDPAHTPAPGVIKLVIDDAEFRSTAYRAASKTAHPDTGGSETLMRRVNAARDMIERGQKAGG